MASKIVCGKRSWTATGLTLITLAGSVSRRTETLPLPGSPSRAALARTRLGAPSRGKPPELSTSSTSTIETLISRGEVASSRLCSTTASTFRALRAAHRERAGRDRAQRRPGERQRRGRVALDWTIAWSGGRCGSRRRSRAEGVDADCDMVLGIAPRGGTLRVTVRSWPRTTSSTIGITRKSAAEAELGLVLAQAPLRLGHSDPVAGVRTLPSRAIPYRSREGQGPAGRLRTAAPRGLVLNRRR